MHSRPIDAKTEKLIEWAIASFTEPCGDTWCIPAGQEESRSLPEGAAEILASQRRAHLFETWEDVTRFGPAAAEPLRRAYGLPEVLKDADKPEGIVTEVGPYQWSDGIAGMLLNEHAWAEAEVLQKPSREDLRRHLFRGARRVLWKEMREDDKKNRAIILHAEMEAYAAGNAQAQARERMELLRDIDKSFGPIQKRMPELYRYCRRIARAADPETAIVDRSLVAKAYHIPEERIDGFLRMMRRKWQPELEELRVAMSLYVKRRKVRIDAESGRFKIFPDEAV